MKRHSIARREDARGRQTRAACVPSCAMLSSGRSVNRIKEGHRRMQRHPYFDLWLHDDNELTTLVGDTIAQIAGDLPSMSDIRTPA